MAGILKEFNLTIAYLDDIIIFSRTAEEHLDHINQVFEKLRSAHLSMKLSKCHFFTKEIKYLGHILSNKCIRPLPSKMQAIKNMHPPKMPKQVHAFLGLVGYYRKFIRNFAKIAKPLTMLTPSTSKIWVDTNPWQCYFNTQGISHPSSNITLPKSEEMLHSLYASDGTCGAQLSQEHDGTEFIIASFHIPSLTNKGNGAPQNKRPMVYITQSQNGIITFRELKS